MDVLVVGRASDFPDVDPGPAPLSSPAPSAHRCADAGLAERRPAWLSFKETRSPYLTLRGMKAIHLERRGNSRVWFVLTITNLIAIPLLAVLTGIVYYRIAIESFSPPYYSIWVRPGEVRHHVEFIISPWRNFLMTIDGEVVFRI